MRNRQPIQIYVEGVVKDIYVLMCQKAGISEASMGRLLIIKELASCGILTPQLKDQIQADLIVHNLLTPELNSILNDGLVA